LKTIFGLVAAALLVVLAFKFFEPVFVWRSGWESLPTGAAAIDSQTADGWGAAGAELDAWLAAARSKLDAPSLSAAISVDGVIVWAGAAGHADIEQGAAATPSTIFRLGSSSKAVTSAAMGVLIDKGAVDLEAPLSRYMPDLSAPLADVTVRQAMSHTGGVRNYGLCLCFPVWEHLNRRHYDGAQRDTLRSFEKSPLLFSPGEGFAYTSLGYNALGGVIEAASGKSFETHVRDAVFEPLGMRRSGLETGATPEGLAQFYEVESGAYKLAFAVDNSNKLPSGGVTSTPSDMTRLGAAMIDSALFSAATRDRLIDPQELADGSPNDQGYALGWRFNPAGEVMGGEIVTPRYSHHGTAQGSTSYFIVYPDYGLVVSVMMNKGQTSLDDLSEQAAPMIDAVIGEIARRRAG
jgi:CubicO group peptidase (beta-lactamase class C family)